MSYALSFEELQQHVGQLPPQQQLLLLAQVSTFLSKFQFDAPPQKADEVNSNPRPPKTQIDAWLAQCDRVADLWQGDFDAAEDLRRMREEE